MELSQCPKSTVPHLQIGSSIAYGGELGSAIPQKTHFLLKKNNNKQNKLKKPTFFEGNSLNGKDKDVSFAAEVKLKGNILRCNQILRLLQQLNEHAEVQEMMVSAIMCIVIVVQRPNSIYFKLFNSG